MAQLKQQQGGGSQGGQGQGQEDDQEQKKQRETEQRSSILNQILEPEAADRLGRIRMVKESRAQMVEDRLIMIARSGQLQQKVNEEQLKQMLASLTEHEKQTGPTLENMKVVRKGRWDEDDLDDLLNES
ncbi:uncharacterized protein HMPREF1541_00201 [Cyphellophora europaea CBS 101466]|uniref:Programmed cell death protein 5 n=1 Tax=Cyphellophora europaea (strain CBS 101466) TaxID=1220924 RepID=W2SDB2_CYPE1|nr:uncharacterized protein HMPREF1541_00201 [Cyphellophora europaea CBS 101466]ETN46018.1 hypothetical protein HMPREF1541_00201 [Cyphellophora europaea CBS 101466]